MKKLLSLLLICISALGLTACDWGPANDDYNEHVLVDRIEFTSCVYCTGSPTCDGCTYWGDRKDISSAYSITCTEVHDKNSSSYCHQHYCVTWIAEKGSD